MACARDAANAVAPKTMAAAIVQHMIAFPIVLSFCRFLRKYS
jgi:hypothetical protein